MNGKLLSVAGLVAGLVGGLLAAIAFIQSQATPNEIAAIERRLQELQGVNEKLIAMKEEIAGSLKVAATANTELQRRVGTLEEADRQMPTLRERLASLEEKVKPGCRCGGTK